MSPLLAQDFPNTAGYPFLALAATLLQHPAVMRTFVSHSDFTSILEGLLARKSPSPKDLQLLMPHVWWRGCKDETASEERLKASVSIITATLAKVRAWRSTLTQLQRATSWWASLAGRVALAHPEGLLHHVFFPAGPQDLCVHAYACRCACVCSQFQLGAELHSLTAC